MSVTPADASNLLVNLGESELKNAGTNPYVEPALRAILSDHSLDSKALPSVRQLAGNTNSKISMLASCILMQDWSDNLLNEVTSHPAFHPKAVTEALTKIKEGSEESLSALQRKYCNKNLLEGEYLVRQISRPPKDGVMNFTVSRKYRGQVDHILIQFKEGLWIADRKKHPSFGSAVNTCKKDLKPAEVVPSEIRNHRNYNASKKSKFMIVDSALPDTFNEGIVTKHYQYKRGKFIANFTYTRTDNSEPFWMTDTGRIHGTLDSMLDQLSRRKK